jgi:uncharacterized protein
MTNQPLDYFALIHQHIDPSSPFYRIYVPHVTLVTNKALTIARRLGLSQAQVRFIEEAGMLHDIGVVKVKSDLVENDSQLPYICHGTQGSELLQAAGLPEHALVAERHTGVGITLAEVKANQLPLPERDYVPSSLEEKIICYADKFFSKNQADLWREESVAEIRAELAKFGEAKVALFDEWREQFGE